MIQKIRQSPEGDCLIAFRSELVEQDLIWWSEAHFSKRDPIWWNEISFGEAGSNPEYSLDVS